MLQSPIPPASGLRAAGATGRSDRRAAAAAAVVAAECLIFAADGFRCPLTRLAEDAGAPSGSVTDIYLPRWFARNLPAIHLPLLVLIVWLHRRASRAERPCPGPPRSTWSPTAVHDPDRGAAVGTAFTISSDGDRPPGRWGLPRVR